MNGLIYMSLLLRSSLKQGQVLDKEPSSLFRVPKLDRGNQIYPYSADNPLPFDYAMGSVGATPSEVFVPDRRLGVNAYMTGEGSDEEALRRIVQNLLAVNSVSTDEEKRSNSYLNLAYSKVFSKMDTRSLVFINLMGSQPKFVIATNGVPVYSFVVLADSVTYLVYSNEAKFDERVRDEFGEAVYMYTLPMYYNGVCVIQSNFLDKRLRHWHKIMTDRLKVMNALERHLHRRWITRVDGPVNGSSEIDHLASN